jgi:DNA-binding NtrC family response regulator
MLQKDKRINDEFEVMINSLTLEEVIALKLELSTRSLRGKFYGFPIWKSLPELTRDAVLKYALSATRSKKEAARFLGITISELNTNLKSYQTESFFINQGQTESRKGK